MSLTKAIETVQKFAKDLPPVIQENQAAHNKHLQLLRNLPDSLEKGELLGSYSEVLAAFSKLIGVIKNLGDQ